MPRKRKRPRLTVVGANGRKQSTSDDHSTDGGTSADNRRRCRHPFENYAKYLVVTDDPDPLETLKADGFEFKYGKADFFELQDKMLPIPSLSIPLKAEAIKYLKKHQLSIINADRGLNLTGKAFEILRHRVFRQILEMLLVINLSGDTEVTRLFNEGTGARITEHDVRIYRHLFWNTTIMSQQDWYEFLFDIRTPWGSVQKIPRYPHAEDLFAGMVLKPKLALWAMGFPVKLDKVTAIDDLMMTGYIQAMKSAALGEVLDFRRASAIALKAFGIGQASSADLPSLMAHLRSVALGVPVDDGDEVIEVGYEDLQKVTKGQHSERDAIVLLPTRDDNTPRDDGPSDSA